MKETFGLFSTISTTDGSNDVIALSIIARRMPRTVSFRRPGRCRHCHRFPVPVERQRHRAICFGPAFTEAEIKGVHSARRETIPATIGRIVAYRGMAGVALVGDPATLRDANGIAHWHSPNIYRVRSLIVCQRIHAVPYPTSVRIHRSRGDAVLRESVRATSAISRAITSSVPVLKAAWSSIAYIRYFRLSTHPPRFGRSGSVERTQPTAGARHEPRRESSAIWLFARGED
jgi:hypothetical protein